MKFIDPIINRKKTFMTRPENTEGWNVSPFLNIFVVFFIIFISSSGLLIYFDDPEGGMFRNIIPFLILFWPYLIIMNLISIPDNKIIVGFLFIVMPALTNATILAILVNMFRRRN